MHRVDKYGTKSYIIKQLFNNEQQTKMKDYY